MFERSFCYRSIPGGKVAAAAAAKWRFRGAEGGWVGMWGGGQGRQYIL